MKFYGQIGAGVGFRSEGAPENIVGNNPLGVIKAGLGLEIYLSKSLTFDLRVKYNHFSSHDPGDTGVNHLGPSMGITWRF
jgi:opacity protein-like surface antigen